MSLVLEHFPVGPLQCICTIVGDSATGEALIVDGGAEPERILERLQRLGLRATHLFHTHAHFDHIGATSALREHSRAISALHPADLALAKLVDRQTERFHLPPITPPIFDTDLHDADVLRIGGYTITALHTPGHTPGSMSFDICDGETTYILTGDTLFAGGVGRWDIGGTSLTDIVQSIQRKLLVYPDETRVIPGHGPTTTIGTERKGNPYLR